MPSFLKMKVVIVTANMLLHVVIWDYVTFHQQVIMVFLPLYSPFLNPIVEFFSTWR